MMTVNENDEEDWYCGGCGAIWKEDLDDVLIQYGQWDTQYHL